MHAQILKLEDENRRLRAQSTTSPLHSHHDGSHHHDKHHQRLLEQNAELRTRNKFLEAWRQRVRPRLEEWALCRGELGISGDGARVALDDEDDLVDVQFDADTGDNAGKNKQPRMFGQSLLSERGDVDRRLHLHVQLLKRQAQGIPSYTS